MGGSCTHRSVSRIKNALRSEITPLFAVTRCAMNASAAASKSSAASSASSSASLGSAAGLRAAHSASPSTPVSSPLSSAAPVVTRDCTLCRALCRAGVPFALPPRRMDASVSVERWKPATLTERPTATASVALPTASAVGSPSNGRLHSSFRYSACSTQRRHAFLAKLTKAKAFAVTSVSHGRHVTTAESSAGEVVSARLAVVSARLEAGVGSELVRRGMDCWKCSEYSPVVASLRRANWRSAPLRKKKEKRQEEGEKRMSIGVFLSSTGMGRMEMCADGFSERVPSTRTALYLR